jgi:hypothetical protein
MPHETPVEAAGYVGKRRGSHDALDAKPVIPIAEMPGRMPVLLMSSDRIKQRRIQPRRILMAIASLGAAGKNGDGNDYLRRNIFKSPVAILSRFIFQIYKRSSAMSRQDILLISRRNQKKVYQDLSKEFSAIDTPFWATDRRFSPEETLSDCWMPTRKIWILTKPSSALKIQTRYIAVICYSQ